MIAYFPISSNLLIAYSACLIGMVSPGPSNFAIMEVAMNSGRTAALAMASGVVTGSVTWGLLASFGLSSVLATWPGALVVMKFIGGFYLFWLALKAGSSAFSINVVSENDFKGNGVAGHFHLFLRGAGMHLTNPKAIFVWLSIVSMALPHGALIADALLVVGICACLSVAVFGGYAIIFSIPTVRKAYFALRRWIQGALALLFGCARISMLLSKASIVN
jgi:threonine/homoserine/homoserine lactone efflux protein